MTTGTSNRYDETNIQTMELVYGRGYMSAGGDEEVARIVGTVTITNKKVLDIGCGDGALRIMRLQKEGAKRLAAAEFLAGNPLPVGTQLG